MVLMAVCLSKGKLDRRSLAAHILFYPSFLFKHYFRLNPELTLYFVSVVGSKNSVCNPGRMVSALAVPMALDRVIT